MKTAAVLIGDVRSRGRGIWQLKCPHPREFAIQEKKNANARGLARGGGMGAVGIDWCIKHNTEGHIKVISDLFLDSCGFGVIVPIVSAERLKAFFFYAVRGILGKLGPWSVFQLVVNEFPTIKEAKG